MTLELYDQFTMNGGLVDLSSRAKFRLTGNDRVRYLNGQVTNDVRLATATEALYACVTDAKGRIAGDVFIHIDGDSLLIDAEPGLRDTLATRLERYIVADDVVLEDVTEDFSLWHMFAGVTVLSRVEGSVRQVGNSVRLGIPGADLWLPASASHPLLSGPVLSAEDFEALRILRGIPRWPNELGGDVFPQEAGLETRAMSFTKGCYIGQEVLSRIKSTGRMPRELVRWKAREMSASFEAGDELWLEDKAIGRITSVTRHPSLGSSVGLGFVKQGSAALDSILLATKGAPSIKARIDISAFVK